MAERRKAALAFIFASMILDIVAFGIVIPVLPQLIKGFLQGDTAQAARWYGIFGTTWAAMQFICSPLLGALSDRFGRRPVLLVSIFGLGLDYLLMAFAPSLTWLFIGRVLSGMTAAGFTTATAYIADVTPPEKRAGAFGLVGAAWGFGFIIGPALGGLLGAANPRLPFMVAGGLALANALYGIFVLPESHPQERRAPFSLARANPIGALQLLRRHHELLGLAAASLLYAIGHTVFPSVFVLWAGYVLGWEAKAIGYSLAIVGVLNVIVQGGLVRPLVRKLGERTALRIGAIAGAVGFTVYGLAASVPIFWLGAVLYAPAGLFNPSLLGLISKQVGPSEQGQVQGANSSLMAIAGMIGPALFTGAFSWAIGAGLRWHIPGVPFLLAAALFALAGITALHATRARALMLLLVLAPLTADAQSRAGRWQQIGTTVTGNPVYVDPKSVKTANGIITATIRTTYTTPVATPKGPITASRAIAMFDCAKRRVAVKESIIWHDERKGTIYEKRAPTQPGFGPAFTSNFSGVALAHLCQARPA